MRKRGERERREREREGSEKERGERATDTEATTLQHTMVGGTCLTRGVISQTKQQNRQCGMYHFHAEISHRQSPM